MEMLGGLRLVSVPNATVYAADSWLRQSRGWLGRHALDRDNDVLEVVG